MGAGYNLIKKGEREGNPHLKAFLPTTDIIAKTFPSWPNPSRDCMAQLVFMPVVMSTSVRPGADSLSCSLTRRGCPLSWFVQVAPVRALTRPTFPRF